MFLAFMLTSITKKKNSIDQAQRYVYVFLFFCFFFFRVVFLYRVLALRALRVDIHDNVGTYAR